MYSSGRFDEGLKLILEKHAEIIAIIAPTLREENRAGWSPFMPICPKCGQVVERAVTAYHPERASIEFTCEKSAGGTSGCGFSGEQSVLGGMAKVQWKVDWALRWYVLKVDYELYGKDLTDSARLSGQILRVMGARAPLGFPFEMLLDEQGHKISKSVGRGVSVEQWTRYAPIEVLKFFLLLNPRRARKLFLEAIPQYVDEYLDAVREYAAASDEQRRESVLEFVIQSRTPTRFNSTLTFGLMMNAVAALGSSDRDFIWNYIVRYDASIAGDPETEKMGRALMECALNFYRDFVEPTKKLYTPSEADRAQLKTLAAYLRENQSASAEEIEKKTLRSRPRKLRQARQDFPAAIPLDPGPGARPPPRRFYQAGHAGKNRRTARRHHRANRLARPTMQPLRRKLWLGGLILILCANAARAQQDAGSMRSQQEPSPSVTQPAAPQSTLELPTRPSNPVLEIPGNNLTRRSRSCCLRSS